MVLTLATTKASGEATRLAASVMLHFKYVQGEEEAYLAGLSRRSPDLQVRTLAAEVSELFNEPNISRTFASLARSSRQRPLHSSST
jgi:hypothetical protein